MHASARAQHNIPDVLWLCLFGFFACFFPPDHFKRVEITSKRDSPPFNCSYVSKAGKGWRRPPQEIIPNVKAGPHMLSGSAAEVIINPVMAWHLSSLSHIVLNPCNRQAVTATAAALTAIDSVRLWRSIRPAFLYFPYPPMTTVQWTRLHTKRWVVKYHAWCYLYARATPLPDTAANEFVRLLSHSQRRGQRETEIIYKLVICASPAWVICRLQTNWEITSSHILSF